jgi:vancomycin permeability regulator SanA
LARVGVGAAALALAAVFAAEAAFWIAASTPRPPHGAGCAVLVLGYPANDDGTAGAVLRARVATGVAALREHGCARLVLSGGAAHNAVVEADVMGHVAEELGVAASAIVLERAATNTWENVAFGLPLAGDAPVLFVASDALHARRGRRYVCRQRPDRCDRAFAVSAYVPFERFWWKVPAALYELRAWLRDRAAP